MQTERRAQLQFLAEGMVAVPVTRASRVTFDDRQLEFVKSVPEGLYPEQNRSVRGKRAGPQIRLTGSQDEVTVLFFQRLESDPRRLNDPILVSIVE
ncbi:MAG: hypothetical protein EHM18_14315 [Acidobacteria bacterium]|nr:MAG: hypothetical protein EHM18_14315 [Acidobacteriota bacterium]